MVGSKIALGTLMTFRARFATLFLSALAMAWAQPKAHSKTGVDWPIYGGSPEGTRYSPLKQINRSNVSRLHVAWSYDVSAGAGRGGLQTHPIVVHGTVYGNTPAGHVVALDGASGKPVWTWDSKM